MPELRITETSPTLVVEFVDTEKQTGTPGENRRPLGKIGHPVTGEKVAWDRCRCEPIDAAGNPVNDGRDAEGVRILIEGR